MIPPLAPTPTPTPSHQIESLTKSKAATVRSRYKRQLIRLNMKKKWPIRTGMVDSRPILFCKRFSYNENALYCCLPQFWPMPSMSRGVINCAKLFLSHPPSRIKWFDQWAVDQDQASPRVSVLATSTVFGSDPATEYWLTVRLTFRRPSMSISQT